MNSRSKRKRPAGRELRLETLESRMCLDTGVGAVDWKPTDVNHDNQVTAMDALLVINALIERQAGAEGEPSEMDVDVNNDNQVTAMDALLVVNDLLTAESSASAATSVSTTDTTTSTDATDATVTDDSGTTADPTTCDGHSREPLSSFDANSDGLLAESELPARLWTKLSSTDTDGDGAISQAELQAAAPARHVQRLFGKFDADQDGSLVESEVPAPLWTKLSPADANADSALSREEVTAAAGESLPPHPHGREPSERIPGGRVPGGRGPERLIERFDANGDGQLTEDEVASGLWTKLGAADANGDGAVTLEELLAAAPRPDRVPRGGGQGPGGNPSDRLFAEFDANDDSSLSSDELPATIWSRISAADMDGDGQVTQAELASFRPARPTREAPPMRGRGGRRF